MLARELTFRSAPAHTCTVHVGAGAHERLARDLARRPAGARLVVVSDHRVAPLYGEPITRALARRGLSVDLLKFRAGEGSKTRRTKSRLEDRMLALGAGRDTAVVAVGGGVTGDLAGFLAASWHRGVPLVQVPTTLLAMVDAAIGGKTAVNLRGGKNLVGAVHQPLAVYADTAALDTLPQARLRDGFAEVVKAGVIADAGLFRWLEPRAARLLERRPRLLTEAIDRSVQVKASVVRRDEREAGRRAMLNFGHTVAHALEAASGYRVSHGRAVAIGMVVEAHLAVAATGFPVAELERLERLLAAFGLPTRVPPGLAPERLARAARRDKKARRGRTRYALPLRLGRMPAGSDPTREISDTDLLEALRGLQTGPRRPKLTSL